MVQTGEIKSVEQFIQRVEKLYDVDYGDFKRKVGFYLTDLEQNLGGPAMSADKKELFYRLRLLVVYNNPTTQIEVVRQKAIEMAKRL